jgi:23S rRNA pseudouridine2605 synthase
MAYSSRSGGSGKKGSGRGGSSSRSSGGSGRSSGGSRGSSSRGSSRGGDSKPTWKKSGSSRGSDSGESREGFKKSFGDKPAFKRSRANDDSFTGSRRPAGSDESRGSRTGFKKRTGSGPAGNRQSDFSEKPAWKKSARTHDSDSPGKDFKKKPYSRREDDNNESEGREGFRKRSSDDKPAFKRRRDDESGERRGTSEFKKKSFGDRPAFKRRSDDESGDRREGREGFKKSFGDKPSGDRRRRDDDREGFKKSPGDKPSGDRRRRDDDRDGFKKKSFGPRDSSRGERKPFGDRGAKPSWKRGDRDERAFSDRKRGESDGDGEWKVFDDKDEAKTFTRKLSGSKSHRGQEDDGDGTIRLNKYIANTGLCSRREADEMIEAGVIKVNGKIVTELGTKVSPSDTVHYGDQLLRREKSVYILLNKPKDYITTTDDPQERKTVLDLIAGACDERVYPVGRLDRNTTGVLLLTNDGDLAERLMHPKYGVEKMYQVSLDMNLRKEDFDKILEGVELEDGFIKADELSFVGEGDDKKQVGIVLHSGRNRIVRRLFEQLGYTVVGLDRVGYAGLTKKNLPKGRWRFLEPKEVGFLKMKVGGDRPAKKAAKKR